MTLTTAALVMAAVAPGLAEAKAPSGTNWSATVVAKNAERGRLVTAGRGGEVRTMNTSKAVAGRTRVGQRVKSRIKLQADGTYDAARLRITGRTKNTRVRGAVVERTADRLLLSAGGSVFSVKARSIRKQAARSAAAGTAVDAGDLVVTDVRISGSRLDERRTRDIGDVSALELEGIFLGFADGKLGLAVEGRGLVEVAVPAEFGIQVPAPGDEIEMLVSINADGSFTLLSLDSDEEDGIDFDNEDGEAELEGIITALTDDSVTVEGRSGATLTCSVPAGALSGLAIGDAVELECISTPEGLVLEEIESESSDEEGHDDDSDADEASEDERSSQSARGDD